jgi:uncharacterized protein (TIGR03437 family)
MQTVLLTVIVATVSFAQPQDQAYTISTAVTGIRPATPVLGTNLPVYFPDGMAIDSAGNVFFASANAVFKLDTAGMVTRVAGTGVASYLGDGGSALLAELNLWAISLPEISGLALDSAGNLYIADTGNQRIRKVAPNGIITTIAGTGSKGYSGDGGPAVNAQLYDPTGLAVDGSGNLYIADSYNYCVRKIAPSGIITTIAGPAQGLLVPGGIAVDQNGNLYITDQYASELFRMTPDGSVTTLASVQHPTAVAIDSSGDIFVSQFLFVQKVSASGALIPIAGNGSNIFAGDGGPALQASVQNIFALAVDGDGNIFVADTGNNRVRKIDTSGNIKTVVGVGPSGIIPVNNDFLLTPSAVALDKAGNTWISDPQHNQILKLDAGGNLTVAAGVGTDGFSGDGGPAIKAQLSRPAEIAVDSSGNAFFRDNGNSRIRKIALDGTISTVAGNGQNSGNGPNGDGGPAMSATISNFGPIAIDSSGNLLFADSETIREVLATTGVITTIAGTPGCCLPSSGDGGPATNAHFAEPEGIAIDTTGNIFVSEAEGRSVRKISNGIVTTIAGNPKLSVGSGGDGGPATNARLSAPFGIAVDSAGNLYIADPGNYIVYGDYFFDPTVDNRIRKVSPDGVITTLAGGGQLGYAGDGGIASSALLDGPFQIAVGSDGRIVFVDALNHAVRVIQPTGHTAYITSIQNAAHGDQTRAVSPGEIVNIYGAGLGPAQLTGNQPNNGRYSTQAGGASVTFNGISAPVLYASATQIGLVVPYEIDAGTPASVLVTNSGVSSQTFTMQTVQSDPELFTADQTGTGQAAALNPDGSVNSAANPVKVGQAITLYLTGMGQTNPASKDGVVGAGGQPVLSVSVTIGGTAATVMFTGNAANQISGLAQVNARIPNGVQPGGYVPVAVKVGDQTTSSPVWIAVAD